MEASESLQHLKTETTARSISLLCALWFIYMQTYTCPPRSQPYTCGRRGNSSSDCGSQLHAPGVDRLNLWANCWNRDRRFLWIGVNNNGIFIHVHLKAIINVGLSIARCQTFPPRWTFPSFLLLCHENKGEKSLTHQTHQIWRSAQSCLQAYNLLQSPATKPFLFIADVNYCFLIIRVTCKLICVPVSLMLVFVSSFVSD